MTEMILFVAKFRMWVVDNKMTWDGKECGSRTLSIRSSCACILRTRSPPSRGARGRGGNKNKLIEAQRTWHRIGRRCGVDEVLCAPTFEVATSKEHRAAIQGGVDLVESGEERAIPLFDADPQDHRIQSPFEKKDHLYRPPQPCGGGRRRSLALDPKKRRELPGSQEKPSPSVPKDGPPELVMA